MGFSSNALKDSPPWNDHENVALVSIIALLLKTLSGENIQSLSTGEIKKSTATTYIRKSLPLLKLKFSASKKNVTNLNKSKVIKIVC